MRVAIRSVTAGGNRGLFEGAGSSTLGAPMMNLLGLDREGLRTLFFQFGEKPFRASQLMQWIHRHGVVEFDQMTNLSKGLRARLKELTHIEVPRIVHEQDSSDGTRKWVLQLGCGNRVETVFIPDEGRNTLCISTQVGCALDCAFCSTAQQGFNRNLSAAEIIGQLWCAYRELDDKARISNVVLMGMGEPLLNFDAVVSSLNVMLDDFGYGLSKRRVTLSTSGIVPALDRLREVSDVSLAVSLHAPNDRLRNELVPINRKYPIRELLAACRRYIAGERRKVTFEYVMLDGVNDTLEHANELVVLLKDFPAKVNLIPFNPFPGTGYRRSQPEAVEAFRDVLWRARLITTTRKTRGDDIDAACGQLVGKVEDRTRRQSRRHIQPSAL